MTEVVEVQSADDVADVHTLVAEFVDWLADRYPEMAEAIATYFASQGFEAEMNDLLSVYGPPGGACFLARLDGKPVGCLMMKPHGPGEVEMNRMFVTESARGKGVASALTDRLLGRARELGYQRMVLSGLDKHDEALALYRKLGFEPDDRPPDSGDGEREIRLALIL